MASPEDPQDTASTQSPSDEQSLKAAPSQDQPMDGSSQPASKSSFIKAQLQVGWTFGHLDSLLSASESSEMGTEIQHKTTTVSEMPSPSLEAVTDDSVTPEMPAVPSLDDQDSGLGMESYPTPENSDKEDDSTVRIEPGQSVEHEQSGEKSEPLSINNQEESAIPANTADTDDEGTADDGATNIVAYTCINEVGEGSSATLPTIDTQSDNRPEMIMAPVDVGTKPTKNDHEQHADKTKASDSHESESSSASRSRAWSSKSQTICANCGQSKPANLFYHIRAPNKLVKTCWTCRELVNEKRRVRAARRMSNVALPDNKRQEDTSSTGNAQLETSSPRGLWTTPTAVMDSVKDGREGVRSSQGKEALHNCPVCEKAMPEDKFLRDGYSMRSCNNCAARESQSKISPPKQDGSRKSTSESRAKRTQNALTEACDDAVEDTVSQMLPQSIKRQRGSVGDETVSIKKAKTHESPRLEIEDAGFLDLGVPEQARRARDDVDELSDAFTAFPVGSDRLVGSQRELLTGATTEP